MTDSVVHFHNAGGMQYERLLFCEFIDNSIEAFRRRDQQAAASSRPVARPPPPKIEIHLIYKKGPYEPSLRSDKFLQHIVVLDNGPGMTKAQIEEWAQVCVPARAPAPPDAQPHACMRARARSAAVRAQMANPTADRKQAENAAIRQQRNEHGNKEPCHADGLLGKFGAGSKTAGDTR